MTESSAINTSARFIDICTRFAEEEIDYWYRYIIEPEESEESRDRNPDWTTYRWIVSFKATTPEEWKAKALAYIAWDTDVLSNASQDADPCTRFAASLARDLAFDDYAKIVAVYAEKYGPLPLTYTPEGIWLGPEGRQ